MRSYAAHGGPYGAVKVVWVVAVLLLLSTTVICQKYDCVETSDEEGLLVEFVGSVPQVNDVIELVKLPDLEPLPPGICQIWCPSYESFREN